MSDFLERISGFSQKRLALLASELQGQVEALQQSRHEPVAIVGIGCRFPGGADTPERFWQLLREGVDAVTEVPAERWAVDDYYDPNPDTAGKMSTRWGGFIRDGVDRFDPHFFGISPREAQSMDPQQRLLLEVVWEALEHAGVSADSLAGTRTGVFVGMSAGDYYQILRGEGVDAFDAYTASGTAHSIASGRVSYVLGIQGPSLSIDTACSSSLVAIHQAVHSLRRGECDTALAGGVNLILGPDITIALSRSHMMAPDGRCKAFDHRADGFVRGEGCGVLVLKRLSTAQREGDRVIAVIRGSAANQDGRSNGLTAPNGPSQEAVLRDALADAQLAASRVDFVEAHGTGTSLGDPIEVQALAKVLGEPRANQRALLVGSVKANIGHLEAAAGVAGVIKLAMALQHGEIPGQLHLEKPNPFIPWSEIPVRVPTALEEWRRNGDERRVGGVSSFGFSGTNVHLLMEEAPPLITSNALVDRPVHLLAVSARNEAALKSLVRSHRDRLAGGNVALADAAHTVSAGRSQFSHRVAVVAANAADAVARLDEYLAGGVSAAVQVGTAGVRPPKLAFLFTGQGSQYAGMARELYDTQPSFRAALDRCNQILEGRLPRALLSVIFPDTSGIATSSIDDTEYTQPALFAVEYALASLWLSWGIKPSAVMGHSVGEYVAACVAGVFSLEDGLGLIAERGRLMSALPRNGAMAAVMASEPKVREALAGVTSQVAIAAVNGPESIVISGLATAVDTVVAQLEAAGVKCTRLNVSHAFHSPLVQPIVAALRTAAEAVQFSTPRIDLISNVTGRLIGAEIARPGYWAEHVLAPVQFAPAMQTLAQSGCNAFVEIGPQPTLLGMGKQCVEGGGAQWLPSLRKGKSDWIQMTESLAALFVAGAPVDWSGFDADFPRRKLVMASYPFQRERYWADPRPTRAPAVRNHLHPVLGREVVQSVSADRLFETQLGNTQLPYLQDHRILGAQILPSPVHMEMALAAAAVQFGGDGPLRLDDLVVHRPLILDGDAEATAQLVLSPPREGVADFRISSFDADERVWHVHATGRIAKAQGTAAEPTDLAAVKQRADQSIAVPDYYDWLQSLGLEFGPRFRGVQSLHRRDGEVLARMRLPDALTIDASAYRLHPALLDACFHVVGAALPGGGSVLGDAFLLMNIERIRLNTRLGTEAWTHVTVHPDDLQGLERRETFRATLRVVDDAGAALVEFEGLHFKRARPDAIAGARLAPRVRSMLHELVWLPAPHRGDALPTPQQLESVLGHQVDALGAEYGLDAYGKFGPGLDALASSYVVQALLNLGFEFVPGARVDAAGLAEQLGVQSRHLRLFARMFRILAEDGVMKADGAQWRVVSVPATPDSDALFDELLQRHPDCHAELTLTRRCARELANVLRGQVDPLTLLFPGGSLADTERLYRDSPPAKAYNSLIAQAFSALASSMPIDRPLRVLEIGAGTGSTSAYVLPHLPNTGVEYTFSDVSPLFLNRAREKFADRPFMQYELLDVGRSPMEQGFAPSSFDVIVGANVLHATADLDVTMRHVRALLAPGGLVVLLEGTTPQRFGDLTVGLLEGWWSYTDRDRRDYALMPRASWLKLLGEHGFEGAAAIPAETTHAVFSQQAVFVAQVPAAVAPRPAERWLIVPDHAGFASALAEALEARGDVAHVLPAARADALGAALRAALASNGRWRGIVDLHAIDAAIDNTMTADAVRQGQEQLVEATLQVVQSLANQSGDLPGLWMVTRGAQAAQPHESANPAQATAWGVSHVVAVEHPDLRTVRIDLDPAADAQTSAQAVVAELRGRSREDQIALRQGARLARRLVHQDRIRQSAPLVIAGDRTYLVTGGLRGLGLRVAEWLVECGARHLVLMGRQEASASAAEVVRRLESRGVQVVAARGDVAVRSDVERVLADLEREMPALAGVIHAAGVLDDGVIAAQNWPRFATVMAPKVFGTWHLHTLTRDLDFMVLFSSGASVAGSAGQSNHAAANAFEDAMAWYRQAQGLPTLSINWGPWAEIGAAADRKLKRPGSLDLISPADGLTALEYAMRRDPTTGAFVPPQMAVLASDWSHLGSRVEAVPPLFAELVGAAAPAQTASPVTKVVAAAADLPLRDRLMTAAPNRRRTVLRDQVRGLTVKVLGLQRADDLDVNEPLRQLGLDSLMAVELRNLLGQAVGKTLPATITFDHPSVSALVDHLATAVFAAELADSGLPIPAIQTATPRPTAAAESRQLDHLSESDLAAELSSLLDSIGTEGKS